MRKIGLNVLCASILFASSAHSAPEQMLLLPGITIKREVAAGESMQFRVPFKIKAECVINSNAPANNIYVTMLSKSGSVGDVPLSEMESQEFIIQNGETIKIGAVAGAKVQLKNNGEVEFQASCSVKLW